MSKRILVAVDLSDASMEVLKEGRALATARGAALAVVYVAAEVSDIQPFFPQTYGVNMMQALEVEQIAMRAFEQRVAEVQGCEEIERFFERGSAYAEIVRRAEAWDADLILVGSHGRSGLTRTLLGSVAARVARVAHCPVLVSRAKSGSALVMGATDLSDPSLPAVRAAVEEARLRGASLLLTHVLDNTLALFSAGAGTFLGSTVPLPSPDLRVQSHQALTDLLRSAMQRFGGSGEPLILEGDVVASIVEAVAEHKIELLVIGTHGRTGLSRLLMGSVAEQLLERSACSVLVVRASA